MLALATALALASAASPVQVRVDPADRHPISPLVYGLNDPTARAFWGGELPPFTLARFGGNRWSAYNWENNASSCGNDCDGAYPSDGYLGGGDRPGEAVRARVEAAFARGAAALVTVPMLGWVAADKDGPVPLRLPLSERRRRFKISLARKGAPFTSTPSVSDGAVYQDELVAHLERAFPGARADPLRPLLYSLDNEPDLWGSTHEQVRGDRRGEGKYVLTGYDELVSRSIEHAAAIKDVAPHALVFGPVLSNWNGFANLYHNDAPDEAGRRFFLDYYLDAMRRASERQGRRLLDVLDVHWYAESTSTRWQSVANEWADQDDAMIEARVQAPRSLWDPSYRERSWVADAAGGPVRLIPRLKELVAARFPGTRIAITEYFFHRGGDVSGAIAQADALGVFGREDVYAAALWPQGARWAYGGSAEQTYRCVFAAFRMYRDYDGRGGAFGDVSLAATTTDVRRTSVYASADSRDPARLVLVAINKTAEPIQASIAVAGGGAGNGPARAEVWRLTGGVKTCTGPVRAAPDLPVADGRLAVTLPPLSVSTLVLRR
jgi:hypothetical protein